MYALALGRKDAFGFTPDYEPLVAELYNLRDELAALNEEARDEYRRFEQQEAELYSIYAATGDADDKAALDRMAEERVSVANGYESEKVPIENRIADLERTLTAAGYSI